MSQHDFNIANQTFPSFRADLNDALVAAATMSAGSSAPTTPYAYQLWFDTTTGTWKVRNSGNTAWVSTITTDLATGNVGIGAPPNATFGSLLYTQGTPAVNKPIVSAYSQGNSNNAGFALFNDSGNRGIWTTGSTMRFTRTYEGNSTADVTIDASGNVGIGTAPSANFHAKNASGSLEIRFDSDAARNIVFADNNGTYDAQIEAQANGTLYIATRQAQPMLFAINNSEKMRIDSAGRISINTSAATELLNVAASAGNGAGIEFAGNGTTVGSTSAFYGQGSGSDAYVWNRANNPILFGTNNAEKMRVTATGDIAISTSSANGFKMYIQSDNGQPALALRRNGGLDGELVRFFNSAGTDVGSIDTSSTTTSYNTSSDYRLKTAVTYDWDATSRLKQLKPARFEWIADGDDAVPVDGFLAHEVQDIVPEAISGTKDGMRDEEYQVSAATGDIYTPAVEATFDENGVELTAAVDEVIHSADVEQPEELAEGQQWRGTTAAVMGTRSVPDYQGIDQSKLVPLLVKTIQELEARITALEAS